MTDRVEDTLEQSLHRIGRSTGSELDSIYYPDNIAETLFVKHSDLIFV
jgi:hypothetical protein